MPPSRKNMVRVPLTANGTHQRGFGLSGYDDQTPTKIEKELIPAFDDQTTLQDNRGLGVSETADQVPQSILKKSTMPRTSITSGLHARRKSNTSRSCYENKGRTTLKSKTGGESTFSSTSRRPTN